MQDLSDRARALGAARLTAAALAAGPFLVLALSLLVPPRAERSALVMPAGLLGIVAPAIAWRLQARIRQRAGGQAYVRSVAVGLAVTEAAALIGALVWLYSREAAALIGFPMHVLMVGALWPTEARMEQSDEDAAR